MLFSFNNIRMNSNNLTIVRFGKHKKFCMTNHFFAPQTMCRFASFKHFILNCCKREIFLNKCHPS